MLEFILGDITANKQQWIVQDMSKLLQTQHVNTIFYLVPEHIKFDSELSVLSHLMGENSILGGSIRVQIYSFSRLAWFLLKDTGILSKTSLSKVGLTMLVRHILLEHENELSVYRGDIRHSGFIQQLTDLFLEFRGGTISTEDLNAFEEHYSKHSSIKKNSQKINELNYLYQLFNEQLIGQYIEKEDLYDQLVQRILQLDLSQTAIYVYGYHRFTAKEQSIILALLKQAYKVSVSLALEAKDIHCDVFDPLTYVSKQTYHRLWQLARMHDINCLPIRQIEQGKERYSKGILDVLEYWKDIFQKGYQYTQNPMEQDAIVTQAFASKQAEVEAVANEIHALVSSGHYRYKDIHVLMRQVESYEMLIKPIFKENDIPIFIDNAESMAYHPLVECLSSLYHLQKRNWQYQDVMRLLRTELIVGEERYDVDQLENELLANGYQGKYWWTHDAAWENQSLRLQIVDAILPFQTQLEQARTMKEASVILYQFFEQMGVMDKLIHWRDDLLDKGQLERAREHEQAWEMFGQLLDEFVMVLGNQPFQLDDFYTILFEGFEQAEYSSVPPSLDQVTISSLDTNREHPSKVVFVIGASAEQFPKSYENLSLLSNQERAMFSSVLSNQSYLVLDSTYRTLIEPFVAYQVFASATEKLYLFYPSMQQECSMYIELLDRRFKHKHTLAKYGKTTQVIRQVIIDIRQAYDRQSMLDERTKHLIDYIEKHDTLAHQFKHLKQGFYYKNIPAKLELAMELYPKQLALSVSQLESYFKDPYSHFLQYGLHVKERQLLQLRSADVGNVFHDTLDVLYRYLEQRQLVFQNLTTDELKRIVDDVCQSVFNQPQYRLFYMNNRMAFTKYLLSDTLEHVIMRLHDYAKTINVHTLLTESIFSSRQDSLLSIPPIYVENNRQLILRGKIDRIDVINQKFLSVVDYKSSQQKFDFNRFFEGLSLQLVTYLYVLNQNREKLQVQDKHSMGAFYYHVNNAYETVQNIMLSPSELIHTPPKLTGLLTLDEESMQTVDGNGLFYQAKLTTKQTYDKQKTMPTVLNEDLVILFEYLKIKIKEAGERILAGDIRLQPFKDELFTPSLREFRSISLFDATLPENHYRQFIKHKDVMSLIRGKVGEQHDTN
ncbi:MULTISPECIES: PD-(D/E)XK nuclease family protein [unclassified Granulicatella]|uniref:PD-(D/E)XK nuclease family protein n=1 Tax=unclassified Granulicatella TaxID=2630493 RepID=UPI001072F7BD|nr:MULTISPECIES: PD-(D/E)XK nuclease family protein [unclassified Granulicatella]MBF0779586.1 PD-(D/E)XK nuclease family protein [Granulicatella sp. 19428wC4_WM01]TFU96387.1 hypothetical protein E4T68_00610 [Granulicatella sp. WM01]